MTEIKTIYDSKTGIYSSSLPTPSFPEKTIIELIFDNISFDDNQLSYIEHFKQKRTITRGKLKLEAWRLGQGLINAGFKPGQVIMICAPNSIDMIITFLAAQFAGLIVALTNPQYTPKELRHAYDLTKPNKVFINLAELSFKIKAAGFPIGQEIGIDDASRVKTLSIEKLKVSEQEARKAKPIKRDFNSSAVLAFSSGTTGLPKAVELTHKNFISVKRMMDAAPSIHSQPTRSLSILPFFHVMGLFMHIFKAIAIGDTVHMQIPFNAQLFLKIVKEEKIQVAILAPPIVVAFAKHPAVTKELFSSMIQITSGGGSLDERIQNEFTQKTQTEVAQGWGMTEVTLSGTGTHYDTMPGTCGCVLPGNEIKLFDPDTGAFVGPGKRGELWIRGPGVFKGYYNNPKATKEIMSSDGYLKSGDIAIVNEQGHFTIVDRIKDLIKYKGFQVAPTELEALINQHAKVALSAVIGIYSQEKGTELPRAYVQLKPNIPAQGVEEEIQEYVKANASNPKWLRGGVRIVPVVPVSPSGKVLRKELRVLAKKEEQDSQPTARL